MSTVPEYLRWRANRHPDFPAVIYQSKQISYGQLYEQTSAVANWMVNELGIKPGDRVAFLDKNSDLAYILMFASAQAGAVAVPINWRLAPPEVATVVGDARAAVCFVSNDFSEYVSSIPTKVLPIEEIEKHRDSKGNSASALDPCLDQPSEVCWQLYTSGTTGLPKGAQLTHQNLLSAAAAISLDTPEVSEGDTSLAAMPFYHIGGCGWATHVIYKGCTVLIECEVVPQQLIEDIAKYKVNHGFLVPAVLLFMSQVPGVEKADFSSLKLIVYGASPITPELLKRSIELFNCKFGQVYGLTEVTGAITYLRPADHSDPSKLMSCGRCMFMSRMAVVDQNDNILKPGEIGEIVVKGAQIMLGYWNQPQETQEAMRNGWFHTGDAGIVDEQGYFYIKDRIKDMIVSGGENIYPIEVEAVIAEHPAVADVAVIGVPDDKWGEAVKAVVVLKPGMTATEQEIIDFTKGKLGGFKRPRSVDFVESLPRNPTGKVLKRELKKPYWEGLERQVH